MARFDKIINNINEYFSTAWILLSDTTIFLTNRTKIFHQYESQLRELRHRLESGRGNPEIIADVRKEVAEIRKSLRLQGFNLKLGSLDLKVEGFRNDDAMARGFQRCVIYLLMDGDVLFTVGQANHIELDKILDTRMNSSKIYREVLGKHYLWFKWSNRVLRLSGSATETPEGLEEFRTYVLNHKARLLKKLKKL